MKSKRIDPVVIRLYGAFGLQISTTPEPFVAYNPETKTVYVDPGEPPALQIHDLAHYISAPKYAREIFDFGLGSAPHVYDAKSRSEKVSLKNAKDQKVKKYFEHAEDAACYVNVQIARALFGEESASALADVLSCHNYLNAKSTASKSIRAAIRQWQRPTA